MHRQSRQDGRTAAGAQNAKALVVIRSPFTSNEDMFDKPDSFTDIVFEAHGMGTQIHLHKFIVGMACGSVGNALKNNSVSGCVRFEWPYDTSGDADRSALIKVLQFCYGIPLSVSRNSDDCCAMIATFIRLQVRNRVEVILMIVRFIIESSQENVRVAAKHLKACAKYDECCSGECWHLNVTLAKMVLTKKNIKEHGDIVVDGCLMDLPPKYLDMAEYGEPHTDSGEVFIRCCYAELHKKDMDVETMRKVMGTVCTDGLSDAVIQRILEVAERFEQEQCKEVKAAQREKEHDADLEREKDRRAQLDIIKTELDETLKCESEQKAHAASLESQLQVLTQKNNEQNTQLEHLRSELQDSKKHQSKQATRLVQAQKERDKALRSVTECKKQMKRLQSQRDEALSRAERQRSALAQLNSTLQKERAGVDSVYELLQKQRDIISKRNQALERERALQASLKSQKDQLERSLHSTSTELSTLRRELDQYDYGSGYDYRYVQRSFYQFRARIAQLEDDASCSRCKLGCYFYFTIIALILIAYLLISKINSQELISNANFIIKHFKDRCPSDVLWYRIEKRVLFGSAISVIVFEAGRFFLFLYFRYKEMKKKEEESNRVSRYQ